MSNKLKVAIASLDITAGDKNENINRLKACIGNLDSDTDLLVLPELFSTGFTSNNDRMKELAETNGGMTISMLRGIAAQYNVAVAGSYLARTGSSIFNRAFFIEPSGDETFYDKRHLFSMSSEAKILVKGESILPVVRYRGWNIAVAVCYDLRFPVWCRNVGLKYDLLTVPANWPNSREYAWRHLLIARAIENQAYIIGVNRSGEDKFGCYDNLSLAFDFCGKEIEAEHTSGSAVEYVTLERDALERWRSDFSAWADSDVFEIKP
ncbi:MAG: nitrilase family protein [Muribaculaceae bacterium]|nr:nitrilase family protein [Muribaculaceae bacterium]